jgi:hypothetical protein
MNLKFATSKTLTNSKNFPKATSIFFWLSFFSPIVRTFPEHIHAQLLEQFYETQTANKSQNKLSEDGY